MNVLGAVSIPALDGNPGRRPGQPRRREGMAPELGRHLVPRARRLVAGLTDEPTAFAAAYRQAERLKAEEEAERARLLEAVAREEWAAHIYDPLPYADAVPDPRLYRGTGIGSLYGQPDTERFGSDLGDWRIIPGSQRP